MKLDLRSRRIASACLLALASAIAIPGRGAEQGLKLGKTIEGTIRPGESRVYSVRVKKGHFAKLVLTEPGMAAIITVRRSGEAQDLVKLNLPVGLIGHQEPVCWITASSGVFRIEIAVPGQEGAPRKYAIRLVELRSVVPEDQQRVELQHLFEQARAATAKQDFRAAMEVWERASTAARGLNDREREAAALVSGGATRVRLGEANQGLDELTQALQILREIHDGQGQGVALNEMGAAYLALGQVEKAAASFSAYLSITRENGDRTMEGLTLRNLGNAAGNLGQNSKALDLYEQALAIERELHDRRNEGRTLGNMGLACIRLGQEGKAIEYLKQSLEIAREAKDREAEGNALGNLAIANRQMGRFEEAIDYTLKSLAIRRMIGDHPGEGVGLNNLGVYYNALGQFDQALDYYQQSLAVSRQVRDRAGEARTLNNLGVTHRNLNQPAKALPYLESALAIRREVKDRQGEGSTLSNLGLAYKDLGDDTKAIGYYEQALAVERETGDRTTEGRILSRLGFAHRDLGELEKAISYFEQSLVIHREVEDHEEEGDVFTGLMTTWSAAHHPSLAIFYGKQAVNTTQSIRADIHNQTLQTSFLKKNEEPYHILAELLISEGRLAEAEQVLALLKEEEYFEYIRRDGEEVSALNRRADLTVEEAQWQKLYDEIGGQLMALGAERGALLAKPSRTPEQMQRLSVLDQDISVGNMKFQQFLGELAAHFSAKVEADRKIEDLRETQAIMEDLRELPEGTMAIYTLAAQDKFYTILRTSDAQKAYEYPITAPDLNKKIAEFRQALEDPRVDPRPLGEELYRILLGAMAEDLRQANAKTLMWSLDGALRYLPLAALYDGREYLIERYRVSVMTLASATRLKDRPDPEWRAAGFGVTKAYQDSLALPFVSSELRAIIAARPGDSGVMQGEIKLDDAFTRDAMQQELLKRFPVVHIASHFRFSPGDDSKSFLLLGDGAHFSLAELKTSANLFGGVQLLTLSACNTGVGDGSEVEGFGTLAQRQGAKAVIASLWAVMDESTSRLMQEFYRIRASSPEMTKLEALRQAQLELLRGGVKGSVSLPDRGVAVNAAKDAAPGPAFHVDPKAPYAHPYYWAPFFLMGNWL